MVSPQVAPAPGAVRDRCVARGGQAAAPADARRVSWAGCGKPWWNG